ncbi:MAG: chromate efflux transporter [Caulobacterales bacterium]|nr:chromate efflux transporter [Caulobacterales bacterium]
MTPSLRELTLTSLKIGCLGFGGPAGQISLMHRIFVDEKTWIDEPRYLHALSFCTLLPGPEAQQLATYVGWLLRGTVGGLIAGVLFVLPGAAVVFALAWLYAAHGDVAPVAAAFGGVKAAVMALVFEALLRVGKRAIKGRAEAAIAVAAFLALALFALPFPLVVLVAALIGAARGAPDAAADALPAPTGPGPGRRRTLATAGLWLILWLAPLALSARLLGVGHWLTKVGTVFATLAATSFGGAYALLAWLQQQAVDAQGWLTTAQMVDGLGLAETTPGPLVLVNTFVGFMAGWNATGGAAGWAALGFLMALWQTFVPSFLFIFAGAPWSETLRRSRLARGALGAVMAAVLGVIASLALWFAVHVLFAGSTAIRWPWGGSVWLPDPTSFDGITGGLALAAGVALVRFRVNVVVVILACAMAGLARWWLG